MKKKMDYLFLDVDGVLNHDYWYYHIPKGYDGFPLSCFDPQCVKRVNDFLEETGARLVVSSSWRTMPDIKEIFEKVGLPTDFDVTPTIEPTSMTYYESRGVEIADFLKKHPYGHYVILDDENDFTEEQTKNHFIRTDPKVGLTDENIELAKQKLLN